MAQILIIEDDLDLSEMLQAYFRNEGYEVLNAAWGKDGVKLCQTHQPDLVLLDIRLPDIDGYEVFRQLRAHQGTQNIPILFLTEKSERANKLAGLELGAVDYITKPFDVQELQMRVSNKLRRTHLVNLVTNLPQWQLVEEKLTDLLQNGGQWAILTLTIDGLDSFGDDYGFMASNDVLRAVSQMIQEVGSESDFVGHFGPNGFVIVTDNMPALRERIEGQIQENIEQIYPLQDRNEARRAMQENRLRPMVGQVLSDDGPFETLDALGNAIHYDYLW